MCLCMTHPNKITSNLYCSFGHRWARTQISNHRMLHQFQAMTLPKAMSPIQQMTIQAIQLMYRIHWIRRECVTFISSVIRMWLLVRMDHGHPHQSKVIVNLRSLNGTVWSRMRRIRIRWQVRRLRGSGANFQLHRQNRTRTRLRWIRKPNKPNAIQRSTRCSVLWKKRSRSERVRRKVFICRTYWIRIVWHRRWLISIFHRELSHLVTWMKATIVKVATVCRYRKVPAQSKTLARNVPNSISKVAHKCSTSEWHGLFAFLSKPIDILIRYNATLFHRSGILSPFHCVVDWNEVGRLMMNSVKTSSTTPMSVRIHRFSGHRCWLCVCVINTIPGRRLAALWWQHLFSRNH